MYDIQCYKMAIFVSNGPVFDNYGSKLSYSGQHFGPSVGCYCFHSALISNSEQSSNSRSEFASSLYSRKQVTFLYSLQLKFLRKPHHRNFRHFNACVVHIFVLLKMKTVAILFLPTGIHIDKSGMYLRKTQPITFPENCVRRVD